MIDRSFQSDYAQTVWPAGHRDCANTDYVPLVMSRENRIEKHLLKGHPVFWPPTSGPEGNFYVTSGKGPGHSNLHAFTSDGELLWEAAPQNTLDDLDSFAIINAPVVDRAGDVYVGDRNQLWAFHPDGDVKWVAALSPYGSEWGFMTVVLGPHGYVGGVTTEGKVIFFRRETGEPAMAPLELPGGRGPPAEDTPPRLLWRDLMDPAIKPFIFNLIQGWDMEVANTPALAPESGRIFITGAGADQGSGLLYGIDIRADHLELAFQTEIGPGSGTSPAISHDGERVYALDEAGHMVAVGTRSGEKLWQTREGGGGSASPSVGPDDTVYTAYHDHLLAFRPDGSLAWKHSYDDFCATQIDTLTGFWSWVLSEPVAFVDSLFTVAENEGWLNVVCGYHIKLMPSRSERTLVPLPLKSFIVAVDLKDGAPLDTPLLIPETSEGFITPTLDGNTFVTLSGAISSIFYHMLNPFLPERLEVPNEPEAGLLLLVPVSRAEHARQGLRRLTRQNDFALSALAVGAVDDARRATDAGALQLVAARAILERLAHEDAAAAKQLERQRTLLADIESLRRDATTALAKAQAEAVADPQPETIAKTQADAAAPAAKATLALERVRAALDVLQATL